MTDKQIIERLKTDLDFERSKRKTLQTELQAKEQECEELKKKCNIYTCGICGNKEDCNKLYKTLTEIKEMLKEICMEECSFDWNKTSKKHCGDCDCRYGQILQKISECEVE